MRFAGTSGDLRAHEFGHLLGLHDEYPIGACLELPNGKRPFANSQDQSIMNNGNRTHPRHMRDFKAWFGKKTKSVLGPTELIRIT